MNVVLITNIILIFGMIFVGWALIEWHHEVSELNEKIDELGCAAILKNIQPTFDFNYTTVP